MIESSHDAGSSPCFSHFAEKALKMTKITNKFFRFHVNDV